MKELRRMIVVAATLLGAGTAFGAEPVAPFHQCPPVGESSSCAVLLWIDPNGSLRVFQDPSQPPFDGIEDTLIGVQNDSPDGVSAIPLKSKLDIFGFDGDGICEGVTIGDPLYDPAPPICPAGGGTGYEGPGVSFGSITTDGTAGTVFFNPPLAGNGGSAFFSLEEDIQTVCQPLPTSVPLLHQRTVGSDAPVRESDDYGTWPSFLHHTIGTFGCALTASAMIVNYHAAVQGKAFRTDPRQLNNWLKAEPAGYTGRIFRDKVNWPEVARYARENGVLLFYIGAVKARDDFTLDQYLCGGDPPLLNVPTRLGHFVPATGQQPVGGAVTEPTYYINDAAFDISSLSDPKYNYQYLGLRLFTGTFVSPAGLYVRLHSPAELLIEAPNGLKTGLDPRTNGDFQEIPGSVYLLEDASDLNEVRGVAPTAEPDKSLELGNVPSGNYILRVIGIGLGEFHADIIGYDENGIPTNLGVAGPTQPGVVTRYTIVYNSTIGTTTLEIQANAPVCGNGDREVGEACDDGNLGDGDGCSGVCLNETAPTSTPILTPTPQPTATETPGPSDCSTGDSDSDGICDDRDNCVNANNSDQQDIDRDGLGDVCDDADAPLALRRLRVRDSDKRKGEIIVRGSFAVPSPKSLETSRGIAVRVSDSGNLDESLNWTSGECVVRGSGHIRCTNRLGTTHLDADRLNSGRLRFEARLDNLTASGPFNEDLTVRLVFLPGAFVEGIDVVGTAENCRTTGHGLLCRLRE